MPLRISGTYTSKCVSFNFNEVYWQLWWMAWGNMFLFRLFKREILVYLHETITKLFKEISSVQNSGCHANPKKKNQTSVFWTENKSVLIFIIKHCLVHIFCVWINYYSGVETKHHSMKFFKYIFLKNPLNSQKPLALNLSYFACA